MHPKKFSFFGVINSQRFLRSLCGTGAGPALPCLDTGTSLGSVGASPKLTLMVYAASQTQTIRESVWTKTGAGPSKLVDPSPTERSQEMFKIYNFIRRKIENKFFKHCFLFLVFFHENVCMHAYTFYFHQHFLIYNGTTGHILVTSLEYFPL